MILPGCHSDSMLCEKFLCISLAFIQLVVQPYVATIKNIPFFHCTEQAQGYRAFAHSPSELFRSSVGL